MAKRAYIIHGWGGKPNEHWLPWLKAELEERDFGVKAPAMPNTDEPNIEEWVSCLSKEVGEPDKDTYFVGHSIGCQAIMRYLERLENKEVGGCVFVAGWFKLENEEEEEIAAPWVRDDIDFAKVLHTTRNFIVINSSNDDFGAVEENKKLFEDNLGATVSVLEDRGHFTEGDGITELPEALQAIEALADAR